MIVIPAIFDWGEQLQENKQQIIPIIHRKFIYSQYSAAKVDLFVSEPELVFINYWGIFINKTWNTKKIKLLYHLKI